MQSITDRKQWFLIDWEDAAIVPTKAAFHFRRETHAPSVFQDGHGPEVDIWSVGMLIVRAEVTLPTPLLDLGRRMVGGFIKSAVQGLLELESVVIHNV